MPSFDVVSEIDMQEVRNAVDQASREIANRFKALDYGKVEEASGGTARQHVNLVAGISRDKATTINKFIKGLGIKGVQSQVQGEQLRVSGKKRDDLQSAIQAMRAEDFGIPLQFSNFRD
jgi:cyclic-di-GMP-binding protein